MASAEKNREKRGTEASRAPKLGRSGRGAPQGETHRSKKDLKGVKREDEQEAEEDDSKIFDLRNQRSD